MDGITELHLVLHLEDGGATPLGAWADKDEAYRVLGELADENDQPGTYVLMPVEVYPPGTARVVETDGRKRVERRST